MKGLIHKFEIGNSLTDQECKDLYRFFFDLQDKLRMMGSEYHIAWFPIYQKMLGVKGYLEMRGFDVDKLVPKV